MPVLGLSELNAVLSVIGGFGILYGLVSVKMKNQWYLGEALPAMVAGIALGPIAARFLDASKFGSAEPGQVGEITLGLTRVVICVQLVMAGYQLPAKYQQHRIGEMALLMGPIMIGVWLCTTDPVLSQAVAKGPFADKFVRRELREIISSEAGMNDGFGFPFLMLATFLMRFAERSESQLGKEPLTSLILHVGTHDDVGRQGGGVGIALGHWFIETWIYFVLMSIVYGAVLGYLCRKAIGFALKKRWIDTESFLLLFITGTGGLLGTDDLLASFIAGNALNWDGKYLNETIERHDEVNGSIDVLLNLGGFMYIGAVMPWEQFSQPEYGITICRLFGLGALVLLLRRIPPLMAFYKFMPRCVKDWKEAIFMGYFGPIGIGAVFYVEHAMHLFPEETTDPEFLSLLRALRPVVYFLALFSIVVHGLSIPALNIIYGCCGVEPIQTDPVQIKRFSVHEAEPANSIGQPFDTRIVQFNRFSRHQPQSVDLELAQLREKIKAHESQEELDTPQKELDTFDGRERTIQWARNDKDVI